MCGLNRKKIYIYIVSLYPPHSFEFVEFILGNPGLQRGWEGKGETGSGKKGAGRGGEGKEERGSPGKLLYTDHFSIEEQTPLARCETEALV